MNGVKVYPVKPASLEGLYNAIVRMDTLLEMKRQNLIQEIEPHLSDRPVQGHVTMVSEMSEDDYRDILHGILKKKQQKQLMAKPQETTDDDNDNTGS